MQLKSGQQWTGLRTTAMSPVEDLKHEIHNYFESQFDETFIRRTFSYRP